MRKSFIATLALGALVIASCQKENDYAPKAESPVFTASFDTEAPADPDTKTHLKIEGTVKKSLWDSGDAIRLLNGTNTTGCAAVYSTENEGETASFTTKEVGYKGSEFIAMYPANPAGSAWWNAESDNKTVNKLWLTDAQTTVEGGYDPNAHIAVAYTNTKELAFKNVVALLKISVSGTGVEKISVSANKIVGNFSYNTKTGDVIIKDGENYSNPSTVTLSGTFTDGKDYYIAVLPGTYPEFTLSVNDIPVNKKSSDVTFERGKIYNLGSVRAPSTFNWGVVGALNSWNVNSPILLYDTDGDGIYELKDQNIGDGFKFVRVPDCSWSHAFGVHAENYNFDTEMKGGWYGVYTNNMADKGKNILVSDKSEHWDIYIYAFSSGDWGQGLNFTVLPAGTATPSK